MGAGAFDKRIVILRATALTNAFNEKVKSFAPYRPVWANVKPVSDGERMAAGKELATRMSRFTIRWSSEVADVNPKDRIDFGGRIYDISGVKDVGRRNRIEITAVAQGDA